jgi:regulator of sigma E protease
MLDLFVILRNVAAFVVAIGILVSIHEFGHYWVARRLGVKVLRFSLGFGKPLWTRRSRDGVEWTVSAIPLGGYVKMLDEREGVVAPSELHLAFNRQPPIKRIAIVAAGPLFNFALAIFLCWVVFVVGITDLKPLVGTPAKGSVAERQGILDGEEILRLGDLEIRNWASLQMELIDQSLKTTALQLQVKSTAGDTRIVELPLDDVRRDPRHLFDDLGLAPYAPSAPPRVEKVDPGSPVDNAGVKAGDRIVRAGGVEIKSPGALVQWSSTHPGEVAMLEVLRGEQALELQVIVGRKIVDGKVMGWLGATVAAPRDLWNNLRAVYRMGPIAAIPAAFRDVWQMSALTLKLLYRMVLGEVSVKNISGPISIAQVAGVSASIGAVYFLRMLAFISVGLGVLNLLPVPVLDGGHLLYYVVEMVKGSPLSDRVQAIGVRIGLTLLVALMGLAFYNDIMSLMG